MNVKIILAGTVAGALSAAVLAAAAPQALAAEAMDPVWGLIEVDKLEYRASDEDDSVAWEAQARFGTDRNKVAFKTTGEYLTGEEAFEKVETQLLYQRMVSDFFDMQAGIRQDFEPSPERTYAVLGVNGLAPQWFEVDANLFLSDRGDLSARFEAEYDILLTQRLILQPQVELDVAFSDDDALDIGAGFTSVEAGLRLRYEIERKFAPYVGVAWERSLGETARRARAEGEDPERTSIVAGISMFF